MTGSKIIQRRSLLKLAPSLIVGSFMPSFGRDELVSINGIRVVWRDIRGEIFGNIKNNKGYTQKEKDNLIKIYNWCNFFIRGPYINSGLGFVQADRKKIVTEILEFIKEYEIKRRNSKVITHYEIDVCLKTVLKQSDFPA